MTHRQAMINELALLLKSEVQKNTISADDLMRFVVRGLEHTTDAELAQELSDRDVSPVFGAIDDNLGEAPLGTKEFVDLVAQTYKDRLIADKELNVPGDFALYLGSRGNPDYGQDPNVSADFGPADEWVLVRSLREASNRCLDYIAENELGGGSWAGGVVRANHINIAYISYNGRVWLTPEAQDLLSREAAANRPRG